MSTKNLLDISIIIPFKDKAEMTIQCVKSLIKHGPNAKEILLISNNSTNSELKSIKAFAATFSKRVKVLEYNQPFNYQAMNNWGVKQSSGHFIMFLNNDTELRLNSKGIIERMCAKAKQPKVGVTGCLLLFGDEKTIQHAGVYLMPEGQADHLYITKRYKTVLANKNTEKYPYDLDKDIPLTAVTGAAQVIERNKFDKVKGFDERFIICGGDVDLCLRLNQIGHQTWYVGGGYILHKESQSRKHKPIPYNDFYWSYLSYIKGFNPKVGDPFLPKITKSIRINGV